MKPTGQCLGPLLCQLHCLHSGLGHMKLCRTPVIYGRDCHAGDQHVKYHSQRNLRSEFTIVSRLVKLAQSQSYQRLNEA